MINKIEFLQGLQSALSGNVPPETVRENLRYYSDYIRSEVQKGRSEKDVMEELGDPRLIAKTIIDATPGAGEGMFEEYRASFNPFGGVNTSGSGYAQERTGESQGQDGTIFTERSKVHYYDLNKWYWKLAAVLVAVLVVTLIITVVGGILSILIPLLPVIFLIMLVVWFVRGR